MYYIIANPNSGNKKGAEVLQIVKDYLEINEVPHKVYVSEYDAHTLELTKQALDEGAQLIIAIGGDGTFMEVASAVGERDDVAIGFIPAGNGNDFAYSANISLDVIENLEGILKREACELDYLDVNGASCLNVCGCGLDTEVLENYNKNPKKNKFSYVKSLLKVLCHFNYYKFNITVDDGVNKSGEYMLLSACNGKRFGAKIQVCKEACVDDGLIDFVAIKKVSKWKIPFLLLTFLFGNHLNKKWCEHFQCRKLEINNLDNTEFAINIDGQLYETNKLVVQMKSQKLLCLNHVEIN